jgi:MSHA biogenesis protein MshJ
MNALALQLMDRVDDAVTRLRSRVRRLTARFDARQQRERVAMMVALAAVAFWAADKVWITPAFERARAAGLQLKTAQQELDTLRQDSARTQSATTEQRRQLQAEIEQWRGRLDGESEAMRRYEDTLVQPNQMVELLEHMLPRNGRVRLVDLHSLGRSEVNPAPATAASAPGGAQLYRHGVELTLEGSYADLFDYLQSLERMPRHVLWGGMRMKVEQYPKVVLTVRLYTLSLDRSWLEI